jgi:hypothetical protein
VKACLKNTTKYFSPEQLKLIKDFIGLLQQEVSLQKDVYINFDGQRDGQMTTGVRRFGHRIHVLTKDRLLIDVLRTLAHEWTHEYQHQKMGLKDDQPVQDIGGKVENMANALGGIMVKKFEKEFPKYENTLYGEHES